MGYNDGYEDVAHLEKGRSYDNSLRIGVKMIFNEVYSSTSRSKTNLKQK